MYYRKNILKVGTYHSPDDIVHVTPQRLSQWAKTFNQMRKNKQVVPMHWDHSDDIDDCVPLSMSEYEKRRTAKNTVGRMSAFELSKDGKSAVVTTAFSSKAAARKAAGNDIFVSPVILPKFRDGSGNEYQDVIGALDLVNYPVDSSQGPFVPVTMSAMKSGMRPCVAIRMGIELAEPVVYRLGCDDEPAKKKRAVKMASDDYEEDDDELEDEDVDDDDYEDDVEDEEEGLDDEEEDDYEDAGDDDPEDDIGDIGGDDVEDEDYEDEDIDADDSDMDDEDMESEIEGAVDEYADDYADDPVVDDADLEDDDYDSDGDGLDDELGDLDEEDEPIEMSDDEAMDAMLNDDDGMGMGGGMGGGMDSGLEGGFGAIIGENLEAAGIAAPLDCDPEQNPREYLLQLTAALRQRTMDDGGGGVDVGGADEEDVPFDDYNEEDLEVKSPEMATLSLRTKQATKRAAAAEKYLMAGERKRLSARVSRMYRLGKLTGREALNLQKKIRVVQLSLGARGVKLTNVHRFLESRKTVPAGTFLTDAKRARLSVMPQPKLSAQREVTAEQAAAEAAKLAEKNPAMYRK